ncbi:MAG TPA: hypothetical protein VFQ53_29700 [Kofleriaceae bacterium]|nr:hypothetical protein [Kofleriaceae bacterium]
MRTAVLVTLIPVTSACSLVFPLDGPPPSACGRFVDAEPLPFASELGAVRELSIDDTGTRGFALATDQLDPRVRTPVLTPLALGDDGVWRFDPARQGNLATLRANENVHFGRIAPNGDLFAAQHGLDDDYRVFRYVFASGSWLVSENVSPLVPTESSFAGGEIEINDGFGADRFYRHIPILHVTEDGARYVSIASSEPVGRPWIPDAIEGRLTTDEINAAHDVTGAGLALGPDGDLVLVYAAETDAGSRLYVAEKRGNGTFPVGVPLAELDDDGDEVEPQISRDCSRLTFRRGETIFTARADRGDAR